MYMSAPKRRKTTAEAWRPGRYDCAYCRRDVRGETHLRHLEAEDLALCTDCYSCQHPVAGVKWTEETCKVIDTAATGRPLLVEDWLADQEVRLLDGILQYGFGNWRAVAEHMGGDKTEQMCEEHYETFYLRTKTFPLPDLNGPPKPAAAMSAAGTKKVDEGPKAGPEAPKEKRGASGMVLDSSRCCAADLVGYMPLRGEYDTEWENEAELQIAEIEMNPADPSEEYDRNLQLLLTYCTQLDERQRRRDFVQKFDIIERAARHHGLDRRLTREERSFRTAMRPYAQHMSVDDHEALVKSSLRETTLRRRVAHFRACEAAGIRDLHEANALWRQILAEEESATAVKPGGTSSRSGGGGHAHAAGSSGSGPLLAANAGLGTDGGFGQGMTAGLPGMPGTALAGGIPAPRQPPNAKKIALQAAKASKGVVADPGAVPAQVLVSKEESLACLNLGITPTQYVTCKRLLIAEAARRAGPALDLADAQSVLQKRLDARRCKALWLHCIKAGWLVGPS